MNVYIRHWIRTHDFDFDTLPLQNSDICFGYEKIVLLNLDFVCAPGEHGLVNYKVYELVHVCQRQGGAVRVCL